MRIYAEKPEYLREKNDDRAKSLTGKSTKSKPKKILDSA